MKAKEKYTKSAITGSTFLIDMETSVNAEKQKEMKNFIKKFRTAVVKAQDVSKYLTQSFFYSKMLQKRRLESVGVTIKEGYRKNILRLLTGHSAIWLYDGKNVACNFTDEYGIRVKKYFISNSKKLSIKEKGFSSYSVITNASGASERIKCSNCGHECSVTSFFNGCEYCRTKFNFNDFDNRVSSISLCGPGNNIASGVAYLFFYSMIPITIWVNVHFGIIGSQFPGPGTIIGGLLLFFPVMLAFVVLYFIIYFRQIFSNARTHAIGKKMRKYDKYFSSEHLFGVINSRLSLWAFCDKKDPLLQSVNNLCLDTNRVIDLDIVFFHNMLLKEEGDNTIINCICNIRLVYLRDNNIQKDTGKYRLTLVRNKQVETDLNFNLQSIKCKACGASISLLDSPGVCQSCRTSVNLLNYDWVMTQISKIKGK